MQRHGLQYSPNYNTEGRIDDLQQEFSKIFYENDLNELADADQIGLIDINKLDERESGKSLNNQDDQFRANQSPGAFIIASSHKSVSFLSPIRNFSPVMRAPQSMNRTNNGNKSFSEGPSNYSFRNQLFGAKNDNFSPFKRPFEIEHPAFSSRIPDDDFFLNNDDTLGMMWSNYGSKNPSAQKHYHEQELLPERRLGSNSNIYQDELFKDHQFWQPKNENSNHEESLRDNFWQVKMEANSISQHSNREREEANKAAGKTDVKLDFSLSDKKEIHTKPVSDDDDEDDDDGDDDRDKMQRANNMRITKRMRKMDDGGDGGNSRSSRGLRVLSQKVKQIVQEKKQTSYKEVAEILTENFNTLMNSNLDISKPKDEQNVKRRVYDALNVLVAADVIKKKGKVVLGTEFSQPQGNKKGKNKREMLELIKKRLKKSQEDIAAKKELLLEMIYKKLAIQHLINLNREFGPNRPSVRQVINSGQPIPTDIANSQEEPEVINFPFIMIASSQAPNGKRIKFDNSPSLFLDMSSNRQELKVTSKYFIKIMGDIDVLTSLELHRTSKEFFQSTVEEGLKKFIPNSFVKSLK